MTVRYIVYSEPTVSYHIKYWTRAYYSIPSYHSYDSCLRYRQNGSQLTPWTNQQENGRYRSSWLRESKTQFRSPVSHVILNAFLPPFITTAHFLSSVNETAVSFISSQLFKLESKLTPYEKHVIAVEQGNISENSTYPKIRQLRNQLQ